MVETTKTTTTVIVYPYEKEQAELTSAGYSSRRRNDKALKKSGGLLERAKAYLAERKVRKEKQKLEKSLTKIRNAGYETQHNELVASGFTNPKKNLRVLKKTKGDVVQSKILLAKKKSVLFTEWITSSGYEKQNQQLHDLGYTKPSRNYRALEKNAGDFESARRYLDERKLRRREVTYTYPSDYEEKYILLSKEGFKNRNKTYKALRKADGDVEKARARLLAKNEKYLTAIREAKYDDQYAQLVAAGYVKPRRNLKYLHRAAGDVAKAQAALAEKKAKRDAYKIEMKALGYDDKILVLEKAGFRKRRRNYKALQRVDGDVEKAKLWLLEKKRNRELQRAAKGTYTYY